MLKTQIRTNFQKTRGELATCPGGQRHKYIPARSPPRLLSLLSWSFNHFNATCWCGRRLHDISLGVAGLRRGGISMAGMRKRLLRSSREGRVSACMMLLSYSQSYPGRLVC